MQLKILEKTDEVKRILDGLKVDEDKLTTDEGGYSSFAMGSTIANRLTNKVFSDILKSMKTENHSVACWIRL
mgnify:CR=1 FL=1